MTTSETPVHITEDEDAEEADADVDDGDADVEDKKSSRSRTSRTSRQSRTSKQSRTSRLSRTKSQGRVLKNRIPFALNFEASHDWQVMLLSGTKPAVVSSDATGKLGLGLQAIIFHRTYRLFL